MALDLSEKKGGVLNRTVTVRTTTLKTPRNRGPGFTSISPNLLTIAKSWPRCETGTADSLTICDVNTGVGMGRVGVAYGSLRTDAKSGAMRMPGKRTNGKYSRVAQDRTGSPDWESARRPTLEDYTFTDGGWIFNRGGKWLRWLLPRTRVDERRTRVWSGRCLALLHDGPLILNMSE